MKFTSTKENLLAGINTVQKAISNKGTIPVLTGIYLKAENSTVHPEAAGSEDLQNPPSSAFSIICDPTHFFPASARNKPIKTSF